MHVGLATGFANHSQIDDGQFIREEFAETSPLARIACVTLLRYVCPLAILAVFVATLL